MSFGTSSLVWYQIVDRTRDQQMAAFEKTPTYKQAVDHFAKNAYTLTDVDALLKDRRALQVVLGAFQLEDQIDSRALVKKIITEDPNSKDSLVNKLAEPRYRKLAEAMRPLAEGQQPFLSVEFSAQILEGYRTNEFEKAQDEQAPGMREALYFKRNIGQVEKVSDLMADKVLKRVVQVALGLPDSFGALEYDQQKERLEKSVDFEEFQDPARLEKFIQRFFIMNDQKLGVTGSDPVLQLFNNQGGGGGLLGGGSGGAGLNLLV